MGIAVGTVLVLVTWIVFVAAIISSGLLVALWIQPRGAISRSGVMRHGLWWGLLAWCLFAIAMNLVAPLGSSATALCAAVILLALGIPGWTLLRRRPHIREGLPRSWPWLVLYVAMAVATLYGAAATLGPVTNYDSGLYHLGAISYAQEFSTIPGLANLYSPLGYATVEFPLGALLGNGPWSTEGFRLLNGLIMAMVLADLLLRLRGQRRGPGLWILLIGVLSAWVPMLALVDYWVTSPTQDSSTFVLTVVAAAYLGDAVAAKRSQGANAAAAGALVIILVLIRPTMVGFAAATVIVLAAALIRDKRGGGIRENLRAGVLVIASGVLAVAATTARDYLLSGWLQYPLSVYAFNVPWRAAEPSMDREATLGFHRDPDRLWQSVEGWEWVGAWWSSRWSQWETYELLGLAVVCIAGLAVVLSLSGTTLRWKRLTLAWLPSLIAVVFWWTLTPPSYRFAWGPLFTVVTIPLGWMIWRLTRTSGREWIRRQVPTLTVVAVGVPVILVVAYSAVARMPWETFTQDRQWSVGLDIAYVVAPVVDAPVVEVQTSTGLVLTQPTESDQCWAHFPLCTPRPYPSLRLRGEDLQGGLLP